MAVKISDLPLSQLYERKITTSVINAIQGKEDFSKISNTYCETVCKLKCKSYSSVKLLGDQKLDILIIQDHSAPKGKYDRSPTKQEEIQKGIINFICSKSGFAGLNYRVVNLLKCLPSEDDFPMGKPPSITTLMKCKPYLLAEIQRVKPTVIISLSTAVTKALGLNKHSNTTNRGDIVKTEFGHTVITLHPRVLCMIRQNSSGAMWGNDYFEVIRRDFQKATDIVRGNLVVKNLLVAIEEQRKNITICRTLDSVQKMVNTISSLPEGYLVSVDTETTSLDGMSDDARLLCIQFGWLDPATKVYKAAVVPLWHRLNLAYNPGEAWKKVVPLLVSNGIQKILHNAKFDYLYIYHTTGVKIQGLEFDTMLSAHALDSGIQGCLSLKTIIGDLSPEIGIAGYEGLLPKLTKIKKKTPEGEIDDDSEENIEEETEVEDGN